MTKATADTMKIVARWKRRIPWDPFLTKRTVSSATPPRLPAHSSVFERSLPRADGLPLIGPVPGAKGIYAAYGYGGNGITFSFLAAQLIGDLIAGSTSPLLRDFALDRDGGSAAR
jgi:glycine/D-amino acid oxidase-like deaminating enzyme